MSAIRKSETVDAGDKLAASPLHLASPTTATDLHRLGGHYEAKRFGYYEGARGDFVDRLPDNPAARVLEVGCGAGRTGEMALARGKCGTFCGVELFEDAAAEARRRLSEVVVGDVESMELPWKPESFDALILSEICEHLQEPWQTVSRLAQLVRPGGVVMASSPNAAHHSVIRMLIRGRWDLADAGIMDRTHLRWFTPHSYAELFRQAGFTIESVGPHRKFGWKASLLNRMTLGKVSHMLHRQTNVIGRKAA